MRPTITLYVTKGKQEKCLFSAPKLSVCQGNAVFILCVFSRDSVCSLWRPSFVFYLSHSTCISLLSPQPSDALSTCLFLWHSSSLQLTPTEKKIYTTSTSSAHALTNTFVTSALFIIPHSDPSFISLYPFTVRFFCGLRESENINAALNSTQTNAEKP